MARQATIIDRISDAFGDEWDVREYRPTAHDFDVALGWPSGQLRGAGQAGGPRVILTASLVAYLTAHRDSPKNIRLPIGRTAIKRLRSILGHHWQIDRASWWEDRVEDLSDLTIDEFSRRHNVAVGSVVNARHSLFGPKLRPAGWWRVADIAKLLIANRPRVEIAGELGISVGSLGRMRYALKHAEFIHPAPLDTTSHKRMTEQEITQAKAMLELGASAQSVSTLLNIPTSRIQMAIVRGRLPHTKDVKRRNSYAMEKAVEMVRSGATRSDAAKTFNLNPVAVGHACRRAGVFARKRRKPNV